MIGVILCGGESSRMGSDKGLLQSGDISWAKQAAAKLVALNLPIVISVNQGQIKNYSSEFEEHQMVVDDTALQLKGPLCGVLSVHLQYPHQDLFVLACDMLLMTTTVLKILLSNYAASKSEGAYYFTKHNHAEPLCAIYTASALSHIHRLNASKKLKKHSMKYALEQLTCFAYDIPEHEQGSFHNFNAPLDLNSL